MDNTKSFSLPIYHYARLIMIAWTLIVFGDMAWDSFTGRGELFVLAVSHAGFWLLGLAFIRLVAKRSEQRDMERARTERELREKEDHYRGLLESDLSARSKAEKELEAAQLFMKSVIDGVAEPILVIGLDYRIVMMNRVAREFSLEGGTEPDGSFCYKISHRREVPCFFSQEHPCPMEIVCKTGQTATVVHEHFRSSGEVRYVEILASPLRDIEGNLIGIIESSRDITERKLLEDQLRHAQKMEAIGQLAGGIAHDFNNILTAIIGYTSLLQMKMSETDQLRTYADQVLSASKKAANLTQGLLAFSRKQLLKPCAADLNEIVGRIEKLLWRFIGEDVELRTILTESDLTVMADSGQLEQVLMNLATNARDAMPDGGVLIISTELVELGSEYVSSHYFGEAGMYALISVSDTGVGMDEKTRERIFEPFFTTKEQGKGTGLGLSIVYGIVKQHNGYINVYSEPGKGTTFKIYLPVIQSGAERTTGISWPAVPVAGGDETVLIAEDEPEVRKLIKAVLEEFGYTVIEAADGLEAVNKFREYRDSIRLVILDVVMPRKNGKEAYDEIKEMKPEVKALFASGYAADIIYKKGIIREGLNFIPKPVSPEELLKKVRETLDR